MPPTRRSRRAMLVGLGGLVLGAAGCTAADPRITGGRSGGTRTSPVAATPTPPEPTPPPAGAVAGARLEQGAVGQARGLLSSGRADLDRRRRALVEGLAAAHLAHAAVLLGPHPTGSPTAGPQPSASATPAPSPRATLAGLRRTEQQLAERHRASAALSRGTEALLWASLAAAARSYASALADPTPGTVLAEQRSTVPAAVSDVAAQQDVVVQLHALLHGYQVAIGRLPLGTPARTRAADALVARRNLRDDLVLRLIERRAAVPVAAAAYALPAPVTDAATAGRLIRRMETAFLPSIGQWVAAATRAGDRRLAVDTLLTVSAAADRWGAAPRVWPGWP